jgi:hypothetical protein
MFVAESMSESLAKTMLKSPAFIRGLPKIRRILDVPIPIRNGKNQIIVPKPGYNPELQIFVDPHAPKIRDMSIEEARKVISEDPYSGFCFKNSQSRVHAIARLITPYTRGLMGFGHRVPLWFYNANRPRAGKDYCAGVAQIIYLRHAFEDAPLGNNSEETRKRITAALQAGRRQVHFANCQGYIDDKYFIAAITNSVWNDRLLGSNDAKSDLEIPNEAEFSMSANMGLTYKEDIEPRSRRIELAFYEEHDNARTFPNPFLHDWLKENRARILSAIHALYLYWVYKGMPSSTTPFTSFPKWAEVVGGIMAACELGDPCLPHQDQDLIGGDQKTIAMRAVYELAHQRHPDQWIKKSDLYKSVRESQDERLSWFGEFDGDEKKKAESRLGKTISAFDKRELSNIQLLIDCSAVKSQQHRLMFRSLKLGT